jgi:hypothetical protein
MIRTCFLWIENTEGGVVMSRRSLQIKNRAKQGDKGGLLKKLGLCRSGLHKEKVITKNDGRLLKFGNTVCRAGGFCLHY